MGAVWMDILLLAATFLLICSAGSFPDRTPPHPSASCSLLSFHPVGIKHELQANCYEEVKDRCTLAEKLGGSAVISLEGKPL